MFTVKFTCSADRYVEHYKRFDNKRDAYNFSKRCLYRADETHTILNLVIRDSDRSDARVCEMCNDYYDCHLKYIHAYPDNPFDYIIVPC